MTKLIYISVKFLCGIFALVFGFLGIALIFILALPLVGWNKSKYIFKRVAR